MTDVSGGYTQQPKPDSSAGYDALRNPLCWPGIRHEAWLILRGVVSLLVICAALVGLMWLNAIGEGR